MKGLSSLGLLDGVTLPIFSTARAADTTTVTQGVTIPSVVSSLTPSSLTPSSLTSPATTKDDSMNWLWILIVIPIGIAGAAAMSKSK